MGPKFVKGVDVLEIIKGSISMKYLISLTQNMIFSCLVSIFSFFSGEFLFKKIQNNTAYQRRKTYLIIHQYKGPDIHIKV